MSWDQDVTRYKLVFAGICGVLGSTGGKCDYNRHGECTIKLQECLGYRQLRVTRGWLEVRSQSWYNIGGSILCLAHHHNTSN